MALKYSADLSSNENGTKTSTVKTVVKHMLSPHLKSYISTCQEDPELKSFDSSLHQRTRKLFSSLDTQGKTENISLDSLMEVYQFLIEANEDVAKIIIESKEDVWKNEELRSLVELYFENTTKTLRLFNTVGNCLKKAETSQLIIRFAVKQFETESMDADFGGNKKKMYAKTLEELNKFKAKGDPFGEEFVTQYESVYEQQALLLRELCEKIAKLGKKLKKVKKLRILTNVIFGTAVVSLLALSVVPIPASLPLVVSMVALALQLCEPIIHNAGTWVNISLKEYEKAVKTQVDLLSLTGKKLKVNNEAMETINILVDELITKISSILETVDFAMERENNELATKDAMQEIMKKVEGFTKKIEDVSEKVAKCSKLVVEGRIEVLESIANTKGCGK